MIATRPSVLPPQDLEVNRLWTRLGRFWEMHDMLFAHYLSLGNGFAVEYAGDLGPDTRRHRGSWAGQDLLTGQNLRHEDMLSEVALLSSPAVLPKVSRDEGASTPGEENTVD